MLSLQIFVLFFTNTFSVQGICICLMILQVSDVN